MNNDLFNNNNAENDELHNEQPLSEKPTAPTEKENPAEEAMPAASAPTSAPTDKPVEQNEENAVPAAVQPAATQPAEQPSDVPSPTPTPAPAAPQTPITNSHTYTSYNPAPAPQMQEPAPKKAKKKNRGVSRGALAVACVCTVLLSCASGFIGAYLATGGMAVVPVQPSDTENSENGPVVIYQSAAAPAEGMSSAGGTSSYYNVANLVHASVVEITTEHLVNSYFQYVTQGAGSGIILSTDGYILTNNHVIADTENNNALASTITVRMIDGTEYTASVVGTDADSDIAILKIDAKDLPAVITGNSDNLAVGEEVVAVGNPLGELGGTVTNGIISALDREINVDGTTMNLLQTNTAINPGNSGGGLFNMSGELIGVVNAKSSGTGIEGLGFAIPVNEAMSVAEQLISQGYVSGKPYLGISMYDVTSFQQALYYNLRNLGVYIVGLEEGLNDNVFETGDRIIAVEDQEISTSDDVAAIVKAFEVGEKIKFTVYRGGKLIEVEATCYEWVPENSKNVQFDE